MSTVAPETPTPEPDVPVWLDTSLYPFEHRYLDLGPGRLHYVDEGEGRPVLMLHGNPTWSFMYRHLLSELSGEFRCIAPDYFGFGLSEKPVGWGYRPADHAAVVEEFVETLGLEDVTLVVHDWGGPIGLDYATHHPENVHSLVVANTFVWPADSTSMRLFGALMGSRATRPLIRRYNLFATQVMRAGFGDRSKLTPEIHRHYTAPLATPDDREGSWVFPHEINGSRAWLTELWERRAQLADTPMLLVWGLEDFALGPFLGRWQETFPHAETVTFPTVGHFVPEEAGPDLVAPVREFLETE